MIPLFYGGAGGQELLLVFLVLLILGPIVIIPLIAMWRIYEKAEQPGWAAIIPIYNIIVLMRIIEKPWWWLLLWLIPYANLIWIIWSYNLLAKRFGKTEGFTVGMVFLPFVFLPILGFDNSRYIASSSLDDTSYAG